MRVYIHVVCTVVLIQNLNRKSVDKAENKKGKKLYSHINNYLSIKHIYHTPVIWLFRCTFPLRGLQCGIKTKNSPSLTFRIPVCPHILVIFSFLSERSPKNRSAEIRAKRRDIVFYLFMIYLLHLTSLSMDDVIIIVLK